MGNQNSDSFKKEIMSYPHSFNKTKSLELNDNNLFLNLSKNPNLVERKDIKRNSEKCLLIRSKNQIFKKRFSTQFIKK